MAEKIAYQDPTAGIMEYLNQLGGSKTTTSTGGNTAGLQQVLNQQLQGITPEGASKLLEAIFMEGSKQVPGLATTYAQAAGARTSNNSALQLALQDLQVQLAREGARQLSTNQANAANTAAQLAQATRSTQQVQQPKSRAMQLLPFALANAGKLKKLIPDIQDGASNIFKSIGDLFGSSNLGSFDSVGYGASGADMFGFDYGSGNSAVDLGLDLAGSAIDAFDFGGFDAGSYMDSGSDMFGFDIGTGVADSGLFDIGIDTMGTEFLEGGFLGFKDGGMVNKDDYHSMVIHDVYKARQIGEKEGITDAEARMDRAVKSNRPKGGGAGRGFVHPGQKTPGYADGGYVSVLERGDMSSPEYRKSLESKQGLQTVVPELLLASMMRSAMMGAVPGRMGGTGAYSPVSIGSRIRNTSIPAEKRAAMEKAAARMDVEDAAKAVSEDTRNVQLIDLVNLISGEVGKIQERRAARGQGFANGGMVRRRIPGYADGGEVKGRRKFEDVTSAERRFNLRDTAGKELRGITYNDTDAERMLRAALSQAINGGSSRTTPKKRLNDRREQETGMGDAVSVPGVVGTVAENEAALAGLAGMAVGLATGLPSAAITGMMNAIGIPATTMSPQAQIGKAVMNLALTGSPTGNATSTLDAMGGIGSDASTAAATGGFSADAIGSGGLGIGLDAAPTTGGFDVGIGIDAGAAGIGGTSGSDAGGTSGVGSSSGGDDGVGGPGGVGGWKHGGEIDGPGGPRDDLIPIMVSDGEYVVKADSVKKLGTPVMDLINQRPELFRDMTEFFFSNKRK